MTDRPLEISQLKKSSFQGVCTPDKHTSCKLYGAQMEEKQRCQKKPETMMQAAQLFSSHMM